MSLAIRSIATAVPPRRITQEAAAEVARLTCLGTPGESALLARFYRNSGVRTRHSVVLDDGTANPSFYPPALNADDRGPTTATRMKRYEAEAAILGVAAASEAIARSGVDAADFTHVVSLSCTGFHSPGFDAALVRSLGLDPTIARTHIGFMGCHAALNALRVAKGFTDSLPDARVLIVAVELCSLHYQYGCQSQRVIANSLFADGAAALVATGQDARSGDWSVRAHGSMIVPDSEDAMRWLIRDHGFEMSLAPQVPELILVHLRDWLDRWLARHDLAVRDVRSWAIHPGGPRILAACQRACELSDEQLLASSEILAEYGNMSSPTVLFILERLQRQLATGPCVALAFGPGLTIEAALLDPPA